MVLPLSWTALKTCVVIVSVPLIGCRPILNYYCLLFEIHVTLCLQLLNGASDAPSAIDEVDAGIDAVVDNAAETANFAGHNVMVKPPCTTIKYSGTSIDVMESLEDISNMIYQAEF